MKKLELCDRCGQALNGKGYSISWSEVNPGAFDIHCGINRMWEKHLCGKLCLIDELNEMIDKIVPEVAEKTVVAAPREHWSNLERSAA